MKSYKYSLQVNKNLYSSIMFLLLFPIVYKMGGCCLNVVYEMNPNKNTLL